MIAEEGVSEVSELIERGVSGRLGARVSGHFCVFLLCWRDVKFALSGSDVSHGGWVTERAAGFTHRRHGVHGGGRGKAKRGRFHIGDAPPVRPTYRYSTFRHVDGGTEFTEVGMKVMRMESGAGRWTVWNR